MTRKSFVMRLEAIVIRTEQEAKSFFVAAILAQASREGVRLSDSEQWMLRFSESEPEFRVDPERIAAFESETTDRAYEAKVTALIRGAYQNDVRLDGGADAAYRQARASLANGDHYLTPIIDQALGARVQPGAARVWGKVGTFLVLMPAAALAALFVIGLVGVLVTGLVHTLQEALSVAAGIVLFAGMLWYLIRLIIRGVRA
jgi:hypothetical protein